jgi:hypothetical protein
MLDVRTPLLRFKATITQQHYTQTNSSTKKKKHHNAVDSANHYLFFILHYNPTLALLRYHEGSVLLVRRYRYIMDDIACDIALVISSKSLGSLRNPAKSEYR